MQEKTTGVPLSLNVNGKEHDLEVNPRHSLLEVLRDDIGLTGAKRGCEDGTCGTCTVIVNGSMARACRMTVEQTEGSEVATIEGLASSRGMHSLQKAFIAADAVQCGFCTPGMIMAAKALLGRDPNPTREQIVKGLGSNLCRCTGYTSILEAVTSVLEGNCKTSAKVGHKWGRN